MEFRAVSKFIRISPRKTRLVADVVRGKSAVTAQGVLAAMNKRAARIINKTLYSAISNARQKEVNEETLWIKKIFIDGGLFFKRYMPRAMGRATMIRKRTSHITIILSDERDKAAGSEGVEKARHAKAPDIIEVKKKEIAKKEEGPKKLKEKHVSKEKKQEKLASKFIEKKKKQQKPESNSDGKKEK